MPGPSGYAPAPTDPVIRESRLCGSCATVLTRRPDGSWVHAALAVTGHEPAPWGDVITYGTERDPAIVTEAELRLLDGNR